MGDYTLPPNSTLIAGMTGSGKTTFALQYLLLAQCACRFVFDDLGRAAVRLRVPPQRTANEVEAAVPSRWVIFNPHAMFPGDTLSAFKWFCEWVYEVSKRGPGKKLVLVDEIWQWCSPHAIPRELATMSQTGREEGIELVTCTQLPHKLHASIIGQATEAVCFRLDEDLAEAEMRSCGIKGDIRNLPLGQFISRNRLTGSQLQGRVF